MGRKKNKKFDNKSFSSKTSLPLWFYSVLPLLIAIVTFIVFIPSLSNDFVLWDDNHLIYDNDLIKNFNWELFEYAFTSVGITVWYPLTLISFGIDHAIWGMNPTGFHLTNSILHSINVILVYILTLRLLSFARGTKEGSPPCNEFIAIAAFTALFFGIHPLRVESVAWATERKDVLFSIFLLLSMLSYFKYVRGGGGKLKFYILSLVLFACSLMSKTMGVTLPAALLLLDYYPLGRIKLDKINGWFGRHKWALIDKLPFFAMSLAMAYKTFSTSKAGGTVMGLEAHSVFSRMIISMRGYIFYIYKTLWPFDLAPYYPFPTKITFFALEYAGAVIVFVLISALCVWTFKKYKVFSIAWLYYIGTLVPVIGVVQIGGYSAGDRYTYMPGLALLIVAALAFGTVFREGASKTVRNGVIIAVLVWAVVLSGLSVKQSGIWKDSLTFWSFQINRYPNHVPLAYNNRGIIHAENDDYEKAFADFASSIRLNPKYGDPYNNRANAYVDLKMYKEAITDFNNLLKIDPNYLMAHYNRGNTFLEIGQFENAIIDYTNALKIDSNYAPAMNNRGNAFAKSGDDERAIKDFIGAIKRNSRAILSYNNLGNAYVRTDQPAKAIEIYNMAIKLAPGDVNTYNNRGNALVKLGKFDDALVDYNTAIKLDGKRPFLYNSRANILRKKGDLKSAFEDYSKALTLEPKNADLYVNRARLLREGKDFKNAINDFTRALKLNPNHLGAFTGRGNVFANMGDYVSAIKDYSAALKINPRYASAYNNRGLALARLGHDDKAVKDFLASLSIEPRNAQVHYNLGGAYLRLGDKRRAITAIKAAARFGHKDAKTYLVQNNIK